MFGRCDRLVTCGVSQSINAAAPTMRPGSPRDSEHSHNSLVCAEIPLASRLVGEMRKFRNNSGISVPDEFGEFSVALRPHNQ